MNSPTAIIAEDEDGQRRELIRMLRKTWPELKLLAECADGLACLEALRQFRPSVLFLDIRMPGMTGLEIARDLDGDIQVVFTTAYSEHAIQAFEHRAVDYVLKPISQERLQATVQRLSSRIRDGARSDIAAVLAALAAQREEPARMHWISASIGNTVRMIPLDEVLFFQSCDRYTRVVSQSAEALIRTPLKELVKTLDPRLFWQVHRSIIVRVPIVRAMHVLGGERFELELSGTSERVPVSVAFKERFKGM